MKTHSFTEFSILHWHGLIAPLRHFRPRMRKPRSIQSFFELWRQSMRQHWGFVQLRQLRLVEKEVLVSKKAQWNWWNVCQLSKKTLPTLTVDGENLKKKTDRRAWKFSSVYGSSRNLPSETVVKLKLSTKTQKFWMNRIWRWLNMWSQSLFGCIYIYMYNIYICIYLYVYIYIYILYTYIYMITQCIWTWLKKVLQHSSDGIKKAGDMLGK